MTSERISEIIGKDAAGVLDEVRSALSELCELADRVDARGELARNARLVHEHVDEFFLLMVVGEVKSGKSSFINALLKEKIQAEGPLPLTDRIWVLKYGDEPSERIRDEFVYEREHPNELLRLFNMVDTPGTNSIVRKHQAITESFLPKADLTLFVTSIDRPFSESEHQFLNLISDRWRKKILFILTKIDTHEPADVPKVVGYIKENCRKFYDFEPRVFPISAKLANSNSEGSG
ncbi:MAG: dynamin family protein, partial [Planctomycetota bacterium]